MSYIRKNMQKIGNISIRNSKWPVEILPIILVY